MITLNAPLTLRASYLPLPLFSYLSLITVLVNPAHGIQGCFNTTSFDKNYWHLNFVINLFCSSFPPLLHTHTFFAIPLAEKMHPFFPLIINPKILFPLSSLSQFLLLLNEYACSTQTQTRIGLLEEIPRSGSDSLPLLLGHLGVRAPYATRRKRRYEANQVWMNTTFISQGPQSWGKLAVET